MRVGDLSSGASKLANALKQINLKWEAAAETWPDARAKAFHKQNVEPLLPNVKDTLTRSAAWPKCSTGPRGT
jgi:hypothetical protein